MDGSDGASSASDRDLVIAFKTGDGRAYDEIYRRHSPKVRVVCSRRLGRQHDAEEAVQETFLRAYQALPRFNGQYKLGAWLNRIAINVCIDELRSRRHTEVIRKIEDDSLEAERGPDEIIASRRPEVLAALRELKPQHADVLWLQAQHGLSHDEVGRQLGLSSTQVKSLLHRARLAFKRVLRDASGFITAPFVALRRARRDADAFVAGSGANAVGILAAANVALPTIERILTGAVAATLALGASSPGERSPITIDARAHVSLQHAGAVGAFPPEDVVADAFVQVPHGNGEPEVLVAEEEPGEVTPLPDPGAVTRAVNAVVDPVTEHVQRELDEHSSGAGDHAHVAPPENADVAAVADEVDARIDQAAETTDTLAETIPGS